MSQQKLSDVIASSAFTVMDHETEGVVAFVSGDYVTLGWVASDYQSLFRPGHTDLVVELDDTGPWQHGLGRDGLYGADAAEVYNKAIEMIRQFASGEEE